jgi:ribosome-interacting GTPase 1
LAKRVFCICTKSDIAAAGVFEELVKSCKYPFEFFEVSVQTGAGLEKLPTMIFNQLGIIRIYAKPPGKPADMNEPFTMPAGSTVQDLAQAIHRQLAEKLQSARIWGTGVYDGQNVQLSHVLHDKDIVELHFG